MYLFKINCSLMRSHRVPEMHTLHAQFLLGRGVPSARGPQGGFLRVVPSRHCQQASRYKTGRRGPWSLSMTLGSIPGT